MTNNKTVDQIKNIAQQDETRPKTQLQENNSKLFIKDVVVWGTIVSVVAIAAIMANYYLLEKYDSSFVTPIAEATLLIFNAIFSVLILGEKITSDMIIGLGFILVGICFIYKKHFYIKMMNFK